MSDDHVTIPINGILDLHTFRPEDVLDVVREYIEACRGQGICRIRIIHGKGKGVQRSAVRALLEKHENVASFSDAPMEAGSWGATVVDLVFPPKR